MTPGHVIAADKTHTSGAVQITRLKQYTHGREYKEYDIPYFAHQQLDPDHYPSTIGLPVGKPGWAPAPKEIASAAHRECIQDDKDVSDADTDASFLSKQIKSKSPGSELIASRQTRVAGGRPAVAKRVTAELDSEDEIIVRMKNAKYLEKDIAQHLKTQGRIVYNAKTIGTRWARIRKVLAQRNDDMLDAELTDWHEGDDDVLEQAVRKADETTAKAIADIESRKWRLVSDHMKTVKPVTNFSQNACRERYHAIQTGMVKPTPESIVNPSQEILARIAARQARQQQIDQDKATSDVGRTKLASNDCRENNVENNAWTSKRRPWN